MKPELDEASLALIKAYEQSEQLALDKAQASRTIAPKGWTVGPAWRFIRRHSLLILATTLGVSAIVYYFVGRQPLKYEGQFQLLVEPMTASSRFTDTTNTLSQDTPTDLQEVDYATLLRVLKSQPVLEKSLERIRARYPLTYNNLVRDLTIERIGEDSADKTKLIGVQYRHEDQSQILFVLNQLATGYIQYSKEERQTRIGAGVEFIAKALPEARQKVTALEEQLQRHQQQYRITDPDVEGAALTKQAQDLETQRLEAQRNLQAQKSLYASIEKQLGGLTPQQAIAVTSLTEDPDIQTLRSNLKAIETQIADQSAVFTDASPQLQELKEKRQNLKNLLSQETQNKVGQNLPQENSDSSANTQGSIQRALSQQLIDTLNEIQVLEIRAQAAQDAAQSIDQKLKEFPSILRRHNEIKRKLDVATDTLNQLLKDQETLKVEDAQQQLPWSLVMEPGFRRDQEGRVLLPEQNRTKKIALGILGGFLLGLGAAVLRDKSQNIFHNVEDLKDETRLPLLGSLPVYDDAHLLSPSYQGSLLDQGLTIMPSERQRAFSRAIEDLYAKTRLMNPGNPIRSLVVSSVMFGDGVTTVAMHLAHLAANMGQRVLLVDANMTLPHLHGRLSIPNFEGLSEILHKQTDPNQIIQRSPYQNNLFVLPSGQLLAGASQLLASPHMQYVMEQFHNMFDLVVYDTAPLQNRADASFLSLNADGMILVVGIGKTHHSTVIKTLQSMNLASLPILGIVANFSGEAIQQSLEEKQSLQRALKSGNADDEYEIFRVTS